MWSAPTANIKQNKEKAHFGPRGRWVPRPQPRGEDRMHTETQNQLWSESFSLTSHWQQTLNEMSNQHQAQNFFRYCHEILPSEATKSHYETTQKATHRLRFNKNTASKNKIHACLLMLVCPYLCADAVQVHVYLVTCPQTRGFHTLSGSLHWHRCPLHCPDQSEPAWWCQAQCTRALTLFLSRLPSINKQAFAFISVLAV